MSRRQRSRKSSTSGTLSGLRRIASFQWLFRTNIPRKRGVSLPKEIQKRNFFGLGEVLGVITNPAETVRSLAESRRLLQEARQEIQETRERSQLRPTHTFSPLPGFFGRRAEVRALERALEGEPSFTVLFGASSVGKTALLREVLSRDDYHVLHLDLRIAACADIASLYICLSQQMEQYFEEIAKQVPGYEEFEKEAWGFKHDRLAVERRMENPNPHARADVRTSDIARLMELFQSSLLKYWQFQPFPDPDEKEDKEHADSRKSDATGEKESQPRSQSRTTGDQSGTTVKQKSAQKSESSTARQETSDAEDKPKNPKKKMPVLFFDEAHKLPALIRSTETMKCMLDSMLVLTKQDRLCHVIHATSDPFFAIWLRQLNIMQHCKILTIGDCSKGETRAFFQQRLLPRVPERLRSGLDFETLYDAFGGKLAHWSDFVTDYINARGRLTVKTSSHFLQAHALLNLHIIHTSQVGPLQEGADPTRDVSSSVAGIHPGLGPAAFRIYSPITHPHGPGSSGEEGGDELAGKMEGSGQAKADFSAMQLLKVMSRLAQPEITQIPYFILAREIGINAVDGMVKGRVLDLRWTETVTKESAPERTSQYNFKHYQDAEPTSSGTAVEATISSTDADGDMVPVDEESLEGAAVGEEGDEEEIVGPRLVPITPIMGYAMREVVQEYEDAQSVSEYASLSDVDEY